MLLCWLIMKLDKPTITILFPESAQAGAEGWG